MSSDWKDTKRCLHEMEEVLGASNRQVQSFLPSINTVNGNSFQLVT
jgi:hypothetical protein